MGNEDKRIKVALRLDKAKLKEIDSVVEQKNLGSRNAFIEQAIEFYIGYLTTNKNRYIPSALRSVIEGSLQMTEDRISRLLFKNTVELAMALNVIAYNFEIDDETLKKLRKQCVQEVKGTVGKINFEEIAKYQLSE